MPGCPGAAGISTSRCRPWSRTRTSSAGTTRRRRTTAPTESEPFLEDQHGPADRFIGAIRPLAEVHERGEPAAGERHGQVEAGPPSPPVEPPFVPVHRVEGARGG